MVFVGAILISLPNFAGQKIEITDAASFGIPISDSAGQNKLIAAPEQISTGAIIDLEGEYNEAIQREHNVKQVTQLKMQYEFDATLQKKKLDDLKKESEHKQKEFLYIGILVFTILLATILILLYISEDFMSN